MGPNAADERSVISQHVRRPLPVRVSAVTRGLTRALRAGVSKPDGSGALGRDRRDPRNTEGSSGVYAPAFWHTRAGRANGPVPGSRSWSVPREDRAFNGVFCGSAAMRAPPRRPFPEDKTHKRGIRPDLLLSASTTPPVAP